MFDYSISIPYSPYSLGASLFILVGILNLTITKVKINTVVICFFIIYATSFLASFINEGFLINISRSIGVMILYVASVGWINLWRDKMVMNTLRIFMIVNFIYWSSYVLSVTMSEGIIKSYGEIYSLDSSIVNHHICGMAISISSIFILVEYFLKNTRINLFGHGLILFTFFVLFLTESRSNFMVFAIGITLIIYWLSMISFKSIVTITLIGGFLFYSFDYFFSTQDRIVQRFSLDVEYHTATNLGRVEILKRIPEEIWKNPLGKGAIGGTSLKIFNVMKSPHNQYLTYALQGGIIALIVAGYFVAKIVRVIREGGEVVFRNKSMSAIFSLTLMYWVTLSTIDFGGLFHQIILSMTFLLFNVIIEDKYEKYEKVK